MGRVLEHAARSMGMTAPGTKRNDNLETENAIPTTTIDYSAEDADGLVTSLLVNDE